MLVKPIPTSSHISENNLMRIKVTLFGTGETVTVDRSKCLSSPRGRRTGPKVSRMKCATISLALQVVVCSETSIRKAFGRLEFLGPFRLQLLHMKMKRVVHD